LANAVRYGARPLESAVRALVRRRPHELCHNAVDRHLAERAQQNALVYVSTETGIERRYTYAELYAEINRMAAVMRSLGVKRGDVCCSICR
jgi:Acyl-coenzyme A synthetases/AMP-(fatty) acid ligases